MNRAEKLLKIERGARGQLNYFYNRQQGKDPTHLLTIYEDGTLNIMKTNITSPDVVVALISALKHAVVFMRNGGAFAPVLDDFVHLLEQAWWREYQKLIEEREV